MIPPTLTAAMLMEPDAMALKELRFNPAAELRAFDRAAGDAAPRDMGGYAAVFNSPTVIAGYFREMVAPGAFAKAIKTDDVRALFNHDSNFVIGRNVSKTLVLTEDDKGLAWRATPPDTQWARDLAVSIERGDISGCSFSFIPTIEEWDYSGDMPLRTVQECELYDVSAVTYPAYTDTDVALRDQALRTVEAHKPGGLVTLGPLTLADRSRLDRKRRLLDSLTRA
jgi:uncharacterized protein